MKLTFLLVRRISVLVLVVVLVLVTVSSSRYLDFATLLYFGLFSESEGAESSLEN